MFYKERGINMDPRRINTTVQGSIHGRSGDGLPERQKISAQ
jgi:hypothetical protein